MVRGESETKGQGYRSPRRFNIAQRWQWLYDILHKTIVASGECTANRLVVPSGTSFALAGLHALDVCGVVEETIATTEDGPMKVAGRAWVAAGEVIAAGDNLKAVLDGKVGVFLDSGEINTAIGNATALAGDDFANQPANDPVDVASDSASDVTQTVTVWGLENGGTVIVSEEYILTGAATIAGSTDFDTVLAVVVDAACAGTLTITENSGGATITTLTTGVLQKGWNDITDGWARFGIPDGVGSAATTKIVGIIGTDAAGAALSEQITMSGTADVPCAEAYEKITAILTGDLEAARTCSFVTADEEDDVERMVGRALELAAAEDDVIEVILNLTL